MDLLFLHLAHGEATMVIAKENAPPFPRNRCREPSRREAHPDAGERAGAEGEQTKTTRRRDGCTPKMEMAGTRSLQQKGQRNFEESDQSNSPRWTGSSFHPFPCA